MPGGFNYNLSNNRTNYQIANPMQGKPLKSTIFALRSAALAALQRKKTVSHTKNERNYPTTTI
jgi:hypothetical protein